MIALRISFLVFTLVAVSGCANRLPTFQFDKSRVVSASFDDAWARATGFFANGNIPVELMDKASGMITASDERVPVSAMSAIAACPDMALLINPRAGHMDYNVSVQPIDEAQTRVTVSMMFKMTYFDATSDYVTYDCNSKGEVERRLLDAIGAR